MKTKQLKIFIPLFIFFIAPKNFAQSLTQSSENVTIKIVKRIMVVQGKYSEENDSIKTQFGEKNINGRNLLISYYKKKNDLQNSHINIFIHEKNKSKIFNGEKEELKNISPNENLFIYLTSKNLTGNSGLNDYVTIVY